MEGIESTKKLQMRWLLTTFTGVQTSLDRPKFFTERGKSTGGHWFFEISTLWGSYCLTWKVWTDD